MRCHCHYHPPMNHVAKPSEFGRPGTCEEDAVGGEGSDHKAPAVEVDNSFTHLQQHRQQPRHTQDWELCSLEEQKQTKPLAATPGFKLKWNLYHLLALATGRCVTHQPQTHEQATTSLSPTAGWGLVRPTTRTLKHERAEPKAPNDQLILSWSFGFPNSPAFTHSYCIDNDPKFTHSCCIDDNPTFTHSCCVDDNPTFTHSYCIDDDPYIHSFILYR